MIKLEQVTEILKSSRGKKMEFQFLNMNKKFAEEICYNWKYEGIFSFYNMTEDKEDLQGFLDSKNWNRYSAVLQENSLVGFFMFQIIDDAVFIGLGLKPDLTGKGYGKDFVLSGIDYLKNSPYGANKKIKLCVAQFNKRAIFLYKNIGFVPYLKYIEKTNGGEYPFIKMELLK